MGKYQSTRFTIGVTFAVIAVTTSCQTSSGSLSASSGTTATTTTTTTTTTSTQTTALVVLPASETISPGATIQLTAAGGVSPYNYSVVSGGGTIGSTSGTYTAASTPSTVEIAVQDSDGDIVYATITVATSTLALRSTVAVNSTLQLSASGGTAPYAYAVVAGEGSISSSTGLYVSPSSSQLVTLSVTDSTETVAYESVVVGSGASEETLTLTPAAQTVAPRATLQFTASGGASPYTYSVVSGGGTMNSSSGYYTAPSSNATVKIGVTDSDGNTTYSYVEVTTSTLALRSLVSLSSTLQLTATGGQSPYTYAVASGIGSVNSSTGLFTATGTSGITEVSVEDSIGAITYETVVVGSGNSGGATVLTPVTVANPSFSSTSIGGITVNAVAVSGQLTMAASGGSGPYTYAVVSGSGSINSSTGVFTAPAANTTSYVAATDANGRVGYQTITVGTGSAASSSLIISPVTDTVSTSGSVQYAVSGGTAPYTYSVASGGGSITSTGIYTAPSTAGVVEIAVHDSAGSTVYAHLAVENTTLTLNSSTAWSFSGGSNCFSTASTVNTYSTSTPSSPPYVVSSFSALTSINQINLTAPSSSAWSNAYFQVYVTDEYNSSWIYVGTLDGPTSQFYSSATNLYSNIEVSGAHYYACLGTNANTIGGLDCTNTYNTWGVMLVADTLTETSPGVYNFEICNLTASY